MKLQDGTFFAGISPETGKPMYASPSDAPLKLDFNQAAAYAKDLEVNGKKDFRLPTEAELVIMRKMMLEDKEARKTLKRLPGQDQAGWYWSSTVQDADYARCQRMQDGSQYPVSKTLALSVRPVRS